VTVRHFVKPPAAVHRQVSDCQTLRKAARSTAGAFYEKCEKFSDELSYAF